MWLLTRFDWPGPTLLVTAPDTAPPPEADHFDRRAVDAVSGNGPLQGVLTAIELQYVSRSISPSRVKVVSTMRAAALSAAAKRRPSRASG